MRTQAQISFVIILVLSFLMALPTHAQVHAVIQDVTRPTSWSPFGPASTNLIMHDYSDFGTMFTAFKSGQVDITDWTVQPGDLNILCTNADIWCSSPDPEFGIFTADINNHAPFLGKALQTARPLLAGSLTNVVNGSSTCGLGSGQLTLKVVNLEEGATVYKDASNTITIANQPSGTPSSRPTNDQGGANPNGTYVFPCILAGTYLITGSIITGNATSGSHLGCGIASGCTIAIPSSGSVSATWNVVWNSPSTLTPTPAMPNVMKAIAHLIDKPEFVKHDAVLNGNAACDDTYLAPAHLIQGSPCVAPPLGEPGSPFPSSVLTRECSNLILDTIITACNPVSAFNLFDDNIGSSAIWWGIPGRSARGSVAVGYSGPADIDAACQYLQLAGFTLSGGTTNTCSELAQATVGTVQPSAYPHFTAPVGTHFVVLLRTDPARAHFGQIIADSINMLFGTPNDSGTCPSPCTQTSSGTATVLYYTTGAVLQPTNSVSGIRVLLPICFEDGGTGFASADRWNLCTEGFLTSSTPEFLFSNYHSKFASFDCGGAPNVFPSDNVFHCDPGFDAITNAAEFQAISTPNLSGSAAIFQDAALRAYDVPIGVAVYSRIQQFAELNGWNWQQSGNGLGSSLVIQKGHGTQSGFWSLLNMRQLPGYTPANSMLVPGGGNPNLIRKSLSQDPDTVNIYQATTPWDFEIINQVYDSLLQVNPETAGANQQVIDWMTTSHTQTFNPSEIGCIAGPSVVATSCVKGVTTQTWHLRSDLYFHDDTLVTAQDVVYSILTQRDDPSANGFSSVAFVTNAVALDSKTVQVKLESNSAYYELNIGEVPIVPQHLYQGPGGSICGSISTASTPAGPVNVVANGPASACADPGFDPLSCTGTAGPVAGCGASFPDGSFQGIFVGSGSRVCANQDFGTQAFGRPGGSCASQCGTPGVRCGVLSMGLFGTGDSIILNGYQNYMRGLRSGQGNSLQKESWGDFNNDGVVNILDGSNMAFFFDKPNAYWAHPQYACSSSTTIVDVCVASALAVLFDTGNTAPFGGTNTNPSGQLVGLDPQIDPYSTQLSGSNTCLYYQTTTTSTAQMILLNCDSSSITDLPSGHSLTVRAFVLNNDGTLGATTAAGFTINSGVVNIVWAPGLTPGTSYEIRIYDNGSQIGQLFATL